MDQIQLYNATQSVVAKINSSGMMPALKRYRASLGSETNVDQAESQLIQAADAYIEKAGAFSDDEAAIVKNLHLESIGTRSFWADLTSRLNSVEARQAQSEITYSSIKFATSHLPGVLTLLRGVRGGTARRKDDLIAGQDSHIRYLFPGFLISALIALAAQFISEHYGAPAMLMALLFGIALNFLSDNHRCQAGIAFSARTVLRIGVALLGLRISFEMAADLGWPVVCVIIGAVFLTILFGLAISRLFGHGPNFAFLSAGSVAICGASAAMAISAILPKDERTEERLVFTVVGVTILSTTAMIVYPIITDALNYNDKMAGIFIGATIHDVAQVVGAGFSISDGTGEVATVVKLIRVAMLAPVILIASIVIRRVSNADQDNSHKPPLVPGFVVAFAVLVALNSFGFFPASVTTLAAEISRWALLTAIAAVGMKTALNEVIQVGLPAISLLVAETAFIGCVIVGALHWVL